MNLNGNKKKRKVNGGCSNHSVISCICFTLEYTHTLASTHDIFLKSVVVNDTVCSEMISSVRISVIEGVCSWTKEVFIM